MIRFEEVTQSYPNGYDALAGVNLRIDSGELVFLTGHSGAGKSTLLRLVGLLERCTRGRILVGGHNLADIPERHIPLFRRNVGMIFQDHRLLMDRTVFDNVALPLVVSGFSHRDIGRRVRASLDKVGLLSREKAFPVTLSAGEQQRVGIARAVVNRPPVLLADEPTGNLDPRLSQEVMQLFEEFNRVGVTIVIASHDLALIMGLKHRILTLAGGRLTGDTSNDTGSNPVEPPASDEYEPLGHHYVEAF